MPSPDQSLELLFPVKGMDITTEFELQPPSTSPLAINVRAIEPGTQRNRGGSRPGIRRYVDQKLGLNSLIQHLNIIVDPTIDATLSEVEDVDTFDDETGVLDPSGGRLRRGLRRSQRYVRKGGSGIQPKYQKNSPTAFNDTIGATVGGGPITIYPLRNDSYSGNPTFKLGKKPAGFRGTLAISGPNPEWSAVYTPPGSGPTAVTYYYPYRLKATGNKGSAYANIIITIGTGSPRITPGDYPVNITVMNPGDGLFNIAIDAGSGLGVTQIQYVSSGFDAVTLQAISNANDAAGIVTIVTDVLNFPPLGAGVVRITGDYSGAGPVGPGYNGSINP